MSITVGELQSLLDNFSDDTELFGAWDQGSPSVQIDGAYRNSRQVILFDSNTVGQDPLLLDELNRAEEYIMADG